MRKYRTRSTQSAGVSSRAVLHGALLIAGLAGGPALAQDLYEQALTEFGEGRYAESVITLRNLLQSTPDNPAARVLLGRALLRNSEIAAAETTLRRALAEGADEDLVIVALGRALLYQREFKQLFETVRRGSRRGVLEAEIALVLGEARLLLNELNDADTQFFDAARLAPFDPAPLLGRALVALRNRSPEAARSLLEQARELEPDSPDVLFLDAEMWRFERQYQRSIEGYDKVLAISDGHIGADLGKADALFNGADYEAAKAVADGVLEKLPDDLEALYIAAMSRARLGDAAGSAVQFEHAERVLASLPPESLATYLPGLLLGGAVALALGDTAEAADRLGRYILRNPRNVEAAKLLGSALLRLDDPGAALDAMLPVVSYAADDAGLKVLLGRARLETGDPSEATRLLNEASKLMASSDHGESLKLRLRFEQGVARLADGDSEGALVDLSVAAQAGGSLPAGILLGSLQLEKNELSRAIETARQVVEQHPDSALAQNLLGATLRSGGEAVAARAAFEKAIEIDGNYVEPRINLARMEAAVGRYAEAEARYLETLELQPESSDTMSDLALLLRDQGRDDDAIEWLRRLAAIAPDRINDKILLVQLLLDQGKVLDASQIVDDMEGENPYHVGVLEALAYVAHVQSQGGKARATLRRATRVAGFDAEWLLRLATNQLALDDIEGARWALSKAVNSRPGFVPAERLLARLDLAEGKTDEALARADRLAELAPDQAAADIVLGDVLFEQGKHADAAKAYERASKQKQSAELLVRRSESLLASGDTDAALEILQSWLQELPRSHEVRLALASALSRGGQYERAIDEYRRLLAELPNNPFLMNNLAWLYRRTGRDGHLELAEEAYIIAKDEPAVIDTLGWILFLDGEDEVRALRLLREANTRDANDPRIQYHLATMLAKRGRNAEALALVKRALATPVLDGEERFEGYAEAQVLMDELSRAANR